MRAHKGIFYFGKYETAEEWAIQNDWPTQYIREFERGYAVQSGDSGNYAGPFLSPVTWAEACANRKAQSA